MLVMMACRSSGPFCSMAASPLKLSAGLLSIPGEAVETAASNPLTFGCAARNIAPNGFSALNASPGLNGNGHNKRPIPRWRMRGVCQILSKTAALLYLHLQKLLPRKMREARFDGRRKETGEK